MSCRGLSGFLVGVILEILGFFWVYSYFKGAENKMYGRLAYPSVNHLVNFIFIFSFLVCLTVIYGILNLDCGLVMSIQVFGYVLCWFAMFDIFLKEVIMLFSYIMCLGGVSVLVFAISLTVVQVF